MGNLGPGIPSSSQKEPSQCRFEDHPTVLITPVHSWSRSTGTGGRDQSERLVAINRNSWSRSPGARTYGQQIGVQDPSIYAFQALGVALASTATNFQNTFSPAVDGDVQFVVDAYASVFGQAGSGAQIQQFVDQLNSFEALYSAAGVFGSPSNIDLLARGAVYGQMLGVEHELNPGTLVGTEPGGTTFTVPPDQNNLVLNSGDVVNAPPPKRRWLQVTA
jgi:hypothetical protein